MIARSINTQLHIVPRYSHKFTPKKTVTITQCLDDVTGTYYQNVKIVVIDQYGKVSMTYANRVPQKTLHFVIDSARTSENTVLKFVAGDEPN